jgi:hypothetical protein
MNLDELMGFLGSIDSELMNEVRRNPEKVEQALPAERVAEFRRGLADFEDFVINSRSLQESQQSIIRVFETLQRFLKGYTTQNKREFYWAANNVALTLEHLDIALTARRIFETSGLQFYGDPRQTSFRSYSRCRDNYCILDVNINGYQLVTDDKSQTSTLTLRTSQITPRAIEKGAWRGDYKAIADWVSRNKSERVVCLVNLDGAPCEEGLRLQATSFMQGYCIKNHLGEKNGR